MFLRAINSEGKKTLRAFSLLPFVLPTVVVANAFLALLGPRGAINSLLMEPVHLNSHPYPIQYTDLDDPAGPSFF